MKDNSQKSMVVSLTSDFEKATKYKIYQNSRGELYIVESKNSEKKTFISPVDIYEDILFEIMRIAEDLPFISYEDWSDEEKMKGARYALYFCNKYGLLGMEKHISNEYSVYSSDNIKEINWYPIDEELEEGMNNDKDYNTYFRHWRDSFSSLINEMLLNINKMKELQISLKDKEDPRDYSLNDFRNLNWLNSKAKSISNTEFPDITFKGARKGEPVKIILDSIWYLYRYVRIWDYYKKNEIDISEIYNEIECDNYYRLKNNFSYRFDHNEFGMCWPKWERVLEDFPSSSIASTTIKYRMNISKKNELRYNIEFPTLFDALCHFVMLEIDSENRTFKFCKNCGILISDDNQRTQYCRPECRNQYNVRMHRKRKAEGQEA